MTYSKVGYYKPKLKNIKLLKEYFKKKEKITNGKRDIQ